MLMFKTIFQYNTILFIGKTKKVRAPADTIHWNFKKLES